MYDLIELFYFAYRDFVGDADRLLEAYGFGRAHHRVLHFVSRQPGLTIAALLEILRITKQSLNRVLKELIAEGFIEARAGAVGSPPSPTLRDRGGREAGAANSRWRRRGDSTARWSGSGREGEDQAVAFLLAMIDPAERERVIELIGGRARPDARRTLQPTEDD